MAGPLSEFDPALDRKIAAILAREGVPGAAVAVVAGGKDYLGVYGVKRLAEAELIGPNTAFNVGSTSKAFASAAAAVLVAAGRMNWDDPIREYLPDFQVWNEAVSAGITVRDLASNRAGLPRTGICEFGTDLEITPQELVRRLRYVQPAAPWRSRFTYSNVAHTAVALAVERVADMPYLDFLRKEILSPLGMLHTSSGSRARRDLTDHAGWHCAINGETIALEPVFTDVQMGSAGMCVSGADALRWLRFQLGLSQNGPLPEKGLRELQSPQIAIGPEDQAIWIAPPEAKNSAYCLGWACSDQNGVTILRHSGSDFGINAYVAFVPAAESGVAVYLNKDSKASVEIGYVVLDALLSFERRDWQALVNSKVLPDTNSTFQFAQGARAECPALLPNTRYEGIYDSFLNGPITVAAALDGLVLSFLDAPIFNARLQPLGGHRFVAVPNYPGLVSDSMGGRFETTFHFEDEKAISVDIRGIGMFQRRAQ